MDAPIPSLSIRSISPAARLALPLLLLFVTVLCFGETNPSTAMAAATPPEAGSPANATIAASYGKLPLSFEANRGQTDSRVQFVSRGQGYTLFLTSNEAVLTLAKPDAKHGLPDASSKPAPTEAGQKILPGGAVVRLQLLGGNRQAAITQEDELPGRSNYFIGNDPSKWRTNVPNYAKVRYRNVYPGIDLVYYGNQRRLEHDFVVAPGADPSRIRFRLCGVSRLRLDAGDLVMQTTQGELRLLKPEIYQVVEGTRREVAGRYVLKGGNKVGFEIARFDRRQPLVIDPTLSLSYSTYLGGNGGNTFGSYYGDYGTGIAVDSSGNAYVTGYTGSPNFPTTTGAFQTSKPSSNYSVFVTKLAPDGSALVYSTYLGGSGFTEGPTIAVDSSGNAYVTGFTNSSDFPVTTGAFQSTLPDALDSGFVTKLAANGQSLVYSTYLGGSNENVANGIAVDSSGNAYVTGSTYSTDFPTTTGAYQSSNPSTAIPHQSTAFVTTFAANDGSTPMSLVYSTYLGGSGVPAGGDYGSAIAVDSSGNAYVTGGEHSTDFPTTTGAFQSSKPSTSSNRSAFVTKLAANGQSLVYSTYLGGSGSTYVENGEDSGTSIGVDSSGNVYVTGNTYSTGFPTTTGAFQSSKPSTSSFPSGFVAKLAANGQSLVYSTYLGGSSNDGGIGIAIDSSGNAYVTGKTASSNFPIITGALLSSIPTPGVYTGYVTELAANGQSLVYSTYLGGNGGDGGTGIAVDSSGNAYVTGMTGSTNFPTTTGAFQSSKPSSPGIPAAFVAKINAVTTTTPVLSVSPTTLTFTATAGGSNPAGQSIAITNTGGGTLNWTASYTSTWLSLDNSSGTAPSTLHVYVNTSGLAAGIYHDTITVTASGASGSPASVAVTLTVSPAPVLSVSPTTLTFTATAGGSNPAGQPIAITNTGGGTLNWTASYTSTWLSLDSSSGTAPSTIHASVNTAGLAAGIYHDTITVTASGASGSPASVAVTFTVNAAASPDFTVTPNASALTLSSGQSSQVVLTITSLNNFTQAVSFACSGLPAGVTCSFSPSTVTPSGGAVTTTLTLAYTKTASKLNKGILPWSASTVFLAFCGMGVGLRRRRKLLGLLLLVFLSISLIACGGGFSGGSTTPVTIVATSGSLQHSVSINLTTVQ